MYGVKPYPVDRLFIFQKITQRINIPCQVERIRACSFPALWLSFQRALTIAESLACCSADILRLPRKVGPSPQAGANGKQPFRRAGQEHLPAIQHEIK